MIVLQNLGIDKSFASVFKVNEKGLLVLQDFNQTYQDIELLIIDGNIYTLDIIDTVEGRVYASTILPSKIENINDLKNAWK